MSITQIISYSLSLIYLDKHAYTWTGDLDCLVVTIGVLFVKYVREIYELRVLNAYVYIIIVVNKSSITRMMNWRPAYSTGQFRNR